MARRLLGIYPCLLALASIATLFLPKEARAVESDIYYPGEAQFTADQAQLTIPFGINAIVFDTVVGRSEDDSIPKWRFVGPLLIDSLTLREKTIAVTDSVQLSGILIRNRALCETLQRARVYLLLKSFPRAVAGDTLYQDSIRAKTWVVPDLSTHYEVRYSASIPVDTVTNWLRSIKELGNTTGLQIPQR